MTDPAIVKARSRAEAGSADLQERNRLWWEALPMTYVEWDEAERSLSGREAFEQLEKLLMTEAPWLSRQFDFTAFRDQAVLEIGCGAGTTATLFARHGAKMTAVDLTEAAVDMTRRNAAAQGLVLDVRRMDAEKLEFAAGSFDYVFSWGVLHHSKNTEAAFAEVARVLRPGGRGLVMVYNRDSLRYYLKGLIWLLLRGKILRGHTLRTVQQFYTDGFYQRHFGRRELTQALAAAGLATERQSITHMAKQMLPGVPSTLDQRLKARWGWLLIAEFVKRPAA